MQFKLWMHIFWSSDTGAPKCWCPASYDRAPWIQVDFLSRVYITGVITQGGGDQRGWVSRYLVTYSDDGQKWHQVTEGKGNPSQVSGKQQTLLQFICT